MKLKVFCVILKLTDTRVSRWYERFGDAKRMAKRMSGGGSGYEAREFYITADEPDSSRIPQLTDFEICSVKRELLTDGGVYVEILMENADGTKLCLKGGYEN